MTEVKPQFLQEGSYLVVIVPALDRAWILRVVARKNRQVEKIDYGLAPISKSTPQRIKFGTTETTLTPESLGVTYDGAMLPFAMIETEHAVVLKAPEDSELKGKTYDKDTNDILYIPPEEVEKSEVKEVIHAYIYVYPEFVRTAIVVGGQTQCKYMDMYSMSKDIRIGWMRSPVELVVLPGIRYYFRWFNPSNLLVPVQLTVYSAVYGVQTVTDKATIDAILSRKIVLGVHWVTVPVFQVPSEVRSDLVEKVSRALGHEGIPLKEFERRAQAKS